MPSGECADMGQSNGTWKVPTTLNRAACQNPLAHPPSSAANTGVRLLELFGSAANGQLNAETSDLDFLVEFEAIPRGENARCYFGMLFRLEDRFGRKIDLVDVRAIRNPYFIRSVTKDRVVFYAA